MKAAMGLVLATFAGAAAAGDLSEPRYHESSDYSAQVYYRVDFGGVRGQAQSLGLRFDGVRAQAAGAPALFQASFSGHGLDRLAVNGVDLRGAMLSSGQKAGGGFFGSLSAAQWIALGFTVLVFGSVAAHATEGTDAPVSGTGTGGG
jgi:hypothetical protein